MTRSGPLPGALALLLLLRLAQALHNTSSAVPAEDAEGELPNGPGDSITQATNHNVLGGANVTFDLEPADWRSREDLEERRPCKQDDCRQAPLTELYAPSLSGKCSGMVEALVGSKRLAVQLSPESWEPVARHLCRHFNCRDTRNTTEQPVAPGSHCLTGCVFSAPHLTNCTVESCVTATYVTCWRWDIQLVGGGNRCAGRVELWDGRTWGSVCDDTWDLSSAGVVCAQLGCGLAVDITGEGGPFKPGAGDILLVNCSGTERHLSDCSATSHNGSCGHKEDAGVVCSASLSTTPAANSTPEPPPGCSTGAMNTAVQNVAPGLSAATAGCIALTLVLLAVPVVNVLFCWYHRKRDAFTVQVRDGELESGELDSSNYCNRGTVLAVSTNTAGNGGPSPSQQSVVDDDDSSCGPDYEDYDFSVEPAVALETYKNSLCKEKEQRTEALRTPVLFSLQEEWEAPAGGVVSSSPVCAWRHQQADGDSSSTSSGEDYVNDAGVQAAAPQRPAGDLGDSSSTSSGEEYENTGRGTEDLLRPAGAAGASLPCEVMQPPVSDRTGGSDLADDPSADPGDPPSSNDSSSFSSEENYQNVGVGQELLPHSPSSSDSDYDQVADS